MNKVKLQHSDFAKPSSAKQYQVGVWGATMMGLGVDPRNWHLRQHQCCGRCCHALGRLGDRGRGIGGRLQ